MDDLVDISKNIPMTFLYFFMVCQLDDYENNTSFKGIQDFTSSILLIGIEPFCSVGLLSFGEDSLKNMNSFSILHMLTIEY